MECSHGCGQPAKAEGHTCSRCKVVKYCSVACAKAHWKAGHKKECTPPAKDDATRAVCTICLEADPAPVAAGCGCRGDAALVHPDCKLQYSSTRGLDDPQHWMCCLTCFQPYERGPVKAALAARFYALAQAADAAAKLVGSTSTVLEMQVGISGMMMASVLAEQGKQAEAAALRYKRTKHHLTPSRPPPPRPAPRRPPTPAPNRLFGMPDSPPGRRGLFWPVAGFARRLLLTTSSHENNPF